jgi:toxin-antitoxin system PIN domain toxin
MPSQPSARRNAPVPGRAGPAPVHLLDGNLLYALIDQAHVHHAPARRWFATTACGFATCPITQGTLLRLAMRLGGHDIAQALALLQAITGHARHHFWPDAMPYAQVQWQGVMGHRQVTDAYLASLARHHRGKLATFDRGLSALHADVGVAVA